MDRRRQSAGEAAAQAPRRSRPPDHAVHPELARLLRAHLAQFSTSPDGRLFSGVRGGELATVTYRRAWTRRAGMPSLRPSRPGTAWMCCCASTPSAFSARTSSLSAASAKRSARPDLAPPRPEIVTARNRRSYRRRALNPNRPIAKARSPRPARRPPYLRLDRVGTGQYQVGRSAPRIAYPASRPPRRSSNAATLTKAPPVEIRPRRGGRGTSCIRRPTPQCIPLLSFGRRFPR